MTAGLTRHKGLARGGPLRPMSAKKLAELGGFALSTFLPERPQSAVPPVKRKSLGERSDGWCEAQLEGCWGRATDPHHRLIRQRGGRHREAKELSDRLSDLLHLCRWCHEWVHEHPAKARGPGLLLKTGQIPEQEPVLYRGELSYLDDAGNVHDYEGVGT